MYEPSVRTTRVERGMKRMEEIKTHSCAIPNGIHIPLWRTLHAQLRIHLYRLLVHLIREQTRNLQDIIHQNRQHMQNLLLFEGVYVGSKWEMREE